MCTFCHFSQIDTLYAQKVVIYLDTVQIISMDVGEPNIEKKYFANSLLKSRTNISYILTNALLKSRNIERDE